MSFWDDRRAEIKHLIETQPIEDALTWTPIQWTMECGNAEYLVHELKALMQNLRWRKFFETYVEHPWALHLEKYPGTHLRGNTIHHMYHYMLWEEVTCNHLSDMESIFEFGGGFGSMSRLARFVGFKGTYRVLDFPELHTIARNYYDDEGIIRLDSVSQLGEEPYDLLLGMWSITESSAILRNKVMQSNYKNVLMAYSASFGDLHNTNYFENLAYSKGGKVIPIPWLEKNYYFIK